jgi:hypothetical protein
MTEPEGLKFLPLGDSKIIYRGPRGRILLVVPLTSTAHVPRINERVVIGENMDSDLYTARSIYWCYDMPSDHAVVVYLEPDVMPEDV